MRYDHRATTVDTREPAQSRKPVARAALVEFVFAGFPFIQGCYLSVVKSNTMNEIATCSYKRSPYFVCDCFFDVSILRLILTPCPESKRHSTAFLGFGWCWLSTMVVWVSCCVCKRRRPGQGSANSNGVNQQNGWNDDVIRATVCGTLASVVCVANGANIGERGGASYVHQVVGAPQDDASISRTCAKLHVKRSSALRYIYSHSHAHLFRLFLCPVAASPFC